MSNISQLKNKGFQILPISTPAWVLTDYNTIERVVGYLTYYADNIDDISTHIICGSGFVLDVDNNNGTGSYPYFGPIPEDEIHEAFLRRMEEDGGNVVECFIHDIHATGYPYISEDTIRKWDEEQNLGVSYFTEKQAMLTHEALDSSEDFMPIGDYTWQNRLNGKTITEDDGHFYFEAYVEADISPAVWMKTPIETFRDFYTISGSKFKPEEL